MFHMMPSLVSCWMAGWGARGSCPPPNSLVGPWQYPSHRARGQGSKCCWHPFWGTRSQQHLYKLAGQKDGFSNRHPQRVGWGVWQACTPPPTCRRRHHRWTMRAAWMRRACSAAALYCDGQRGGYDSAAATTRESPGGGSGWAASTGRGLR